MGFWNKIIFFFVFVFVFQWRDQTNKKGNRNCSFPAFFQFQKEKNNMKKKVIHWSWFTLQNINKSKEKDFISFNWWYDFYNCKWEKKFLFFCFCVDFFFFCFFSGVGGKNGQQKKRKISQPIILSTNQTQSLKIPPNEKWPKWFPTNQILAIITIRKLKFLFFFHHNSPFSQSFINTISCYHHWYWKIKVWFVE